jgi:hypothetical protein
MPAERFPVKLIRETERAYLVERTDMKGKEKTQFFPKSQVHWDRYNVNKHEGVLIVPSWLVEKKGW